MAEVPERIQVSKLEITTKDGVKIYLGMEEAKELYHDLHSLFGRPVQTIINPAPIVIYPDQPWYPAKPYIWFSSSGGTLHPQNAEYTGIIQHESGMVFSLTGKEYSYD